MRFFLIMTISISLIGGYLYWAGLLPFGINKNEDIKPITPVKAKPTSVKTKPVIAKTQPVKPKKKPQKKRVKLDLSLPDDMGGATRVSFPQPSQQKLNWMQLTRSKDEIEYDAELVFDAKEGSTITGGKISVKIPLG